MCLKIDTLPKIYHYLTKRWFSAALLLFGIFRRFLPLVSHFYAFCEQNIRAGRFYFIAFCQKVCYDMRSMYASCSLHYGVMLTQTFDDLPRATAKSSS